MKELLKLGFEQYAADPYILRYKEKDIILLVYINNVYITAKTL